MVSHGWLWWLSCCEVVCQDTISSVFEPSVCCAVGDTNLKPQAMKHFASHNLLLEAAPTVFPESCSREHIRSSHKTVTQPLSLQLRSEIITINTPVPATWRPSWNPRQHPHPSTKAVQPFTSLPPGRWWVCHSGVHPHGTGIQASWTSNTSSVSTRLPNAAVVLWTAGSCCDTAGSRATTGEGQWHRWQGPISTTCFALQALSCSQSFTVVPTGNIQAVSQRCGREDPYWGMFFPVAFSDKWNQKPQPTILSSSHATSSKLNFSQVRKYLALPVL